MPFTGMPLFVSNQCFEELKREMLEQKVGVVCGGKDCPETLSLPEPGKVTYVAICRKDDQAELTELTP